MKEIRKNKKIILDILKMYFITRIFLVILMVIADKILPSLGTEYSDVMTIFDNEHYLDISMFGYFKNSLYAFFPLTPLLIRYLGRVGAIIVNQLCVIMSSYLFYVISSNYLKQDNPYLPVIIWNLSPIAVFTCMFYSEALFVFLTLLAFYLYKQKKHYFSLGVILGLSVFTRSLGSMLFFAIFVFMFIDFIKKKEKFKNILITYIPATIISCLYPIYLYFQTGNLLYFVEVQKLYWGRVSSNIFTILFDTFNNLIIDFDILYLINVILTVGIIVFCFYNIIKNIKNKNYREMFLYVIFTIISICSSIRNDGNTMASFYRYLYGCFPIYFMFKNMHRSIMINTFIASFVSIIFLMGCYFY